MSWIFDLSTVVDKFLSEFNFEGRANDIQEVEQRFDTLGEHIKHLYAIPIRAWFLENTLWDEIYRTHYPALALEKFLEIYLGGTEPKTGNIQVHKYIDHWVHQNPDEAIELFKEHISGARPPAQIQECYREEIFPHINDEGIFIKAALTVNQYASVNSKYGIRNLTKIFTNRIFSDFIESSDDITKSASQKVDIVIENEDKFPNTLISVKSFAEDNNEINLGSFPPKLLFSGIVDNLPSERTDLGSGTRFSSYINRLSDAKIAMFKQRVKDFVEIIYNDLHLVMLYRNQSTQSIDIEVVDNSHFISTITNIVSDPDKISDYECRVEANAIRFNKNAFKREHPEVIKNIHIAF